MYSEYVKVEPLDRQETTALSGMSEPYAPARIDEPEMPIEGHDRAIEEGRDDAIMEAVSVLQKTGREGKGRLILQTDMPTPPQYAGLLAIYNNPNSGLKELITFITGRGWFTSPSTLYGSKGNPGIFQELINKSLATESKDGYALTEEGLRWVDPDRIMESQSDKAGSEDHKRLMRKTIKMLQDRLQLAIVGREKHSFDILALPVNAKRRGVWDMRKAKGYECQTSAREDSVKENIGKAERWGVPMVWVAEDNEVIDRIRHICRGGECMLVGD